MNDVVEVSAEIAKYVKYLLEKDLDVKPILSAAMGKTKPPFI